MADDIETLILACAGARRSGVEAEVRDGLQEAGYARVRLPSDEPLRVKRNARGEPPLGRWFMARLIGQVARAVVVPNPDGSIGAGTLHDLAAALEGGREIYVLAPDGTLVDFDDSHLVAEGEPSNSCAAWFRWGGQSAGRRTLPGFRLGVAGLSGPSRRPRS